MHEAVATALNGARQKMTDRLVADYGALLGMEPGSRRHRMLSGLMELRYERLFALEAALQTAEHPKRRV